MFSSFEELLETITAERKGSVYEQEHGLIPRCFKGELQGDGIGTITYVTSDGRVALLWAFRLGNSLNSKWVYLYPTAAQFEFFYTNAREHIKAVLEHNDKQEKVYKMEQEKNKEIEWPLFESRYLKVDVGAQALVTLTNWRQEAKKYKENEAERWALVFDVIKVDEIQYGSHPLEWATTNTTLCLEFKPLIDAAEKEGKKEIRVILKRKSQQEFLFVVV
ncbi:hypothetical protein DRH27_05895 [Candidatus Falkowbacteria bacterium]|nr:MAG: hypothetical protein DRH27_05895 [Candidatus Falkowbacteria bacterium]